MKAIEVIREAEGLSLEDEDGEPIQVSLSPGLPPERIEALAAGFGFRLPRELADLLADCSGVEGMLETIDFTGQSDGFEFAAIFPRCIPIVHDGFGNFWAIDASPEGADVSPVFFACHDAPVILYQAPSLAGFLAEVVNMYRPAHKEG